MKKNLNQKLINLIEYYNLINANLLISETPIKRNINKNIDSPGKTKSEKLESLKTSIKKIKNCELKKSAKNLVFGDGNIHAKIMIIGEGPGAQEDMEGKPFVGRAGQLLDKMLESINLNRKKVYISNVVKYRPPQNRRPTEEEIERYFPYLVSHVEIISPKILVLLGSTALNALVGNEVVISKARGQWIEKQFGECKTSVIVTFHPAFLMRQPNQKKMAWIDLKMIREKKSKLRI